MSEIRNYTTGSKGLDDLFGGYYKGIIMQFYGETKSGKTTLSAYVPIGVIYSDIKKRFGEVSENAKFIVIDGDGGFDYERARQIWNSMGLTFDEVNNHIIYWQPTQFSEQHDIVVGLPKLIKDQNIKPLLVVVDPMTAIYRGIILRSPMKVRASIIGQYTGKLDLQLVILRNIAVEYNCPVIITSWQTSPIGEAFGVIPEVEMIGGRAFGFIPKLIVRLEIPEEQPEGKVLRRAYLYKHRARPEGRTVDFLLTDEGISDVE